MTSHVIHWRDMPDQAAGAGVSKRTIAGAGASLTMVRVAAGTEAPKHSHDFEQFVQVLEGEGTLTTEQGAVAFGPGSVFHFPPGTWHRAVFRTETVLVESNLARP